MKQRPTGMRQSVQHGILMMLCIFYVSQSQACELTVAWEPWPPFAYAGANDSVLGVDGEVMTAVTERIGCQVQWVQATWQRQLLALKKGDYDAILSASYTSERASWAIYSEPYRKDATHLFVARALDYRFEDLQQFLDAGLTLGIMRGYYYGDRAMQLINDPRYSRQIRSTVAIDANMQRLKRGLVDGIVTQHLVGNYLRKQLQAQQQVTANSIELASEDLYFLFSKASVDPNMVDQFNRALLALKEEGVVQQIIERQRTNEQPPLDHHSNESANTRSSNNRALAWRR